MKPTVEQMITALKACAVEESQEEHPCDACYLYPIQKEGRMSTGRSCFEHLTHDLIEVLSRVTETGGN